MQLDQSVKRHLIIRNWKAMKAAGLPSKDWQHIRDTWHDQMRDYCAMEAFVNGVRARVSGEYPDYETIMTITRPIEDTD